MLGPARAAAADGHATWHRSPCLGLCERAPAALVDGAPAAPPRDTRSGAGHRAATSLDRRWSGAPCRSRTSRSRCRRREAGQPGLKLLRPRRPGRSRQPRRLPRRRRLPRPAPRLRDGPGGGGPRGHRAKLVGRGGAAFPTGVKWEAARAARCCPHYLVCNADESEPGTFKDRVADGARSVRADRGDDHRGLRHRLRAGATSTSAASIRWRWRGSSNAIRARRDRGFLGDNILGDGVRFDIELRRGAGAYICGEETALLNSIEGTAASRATSRRSPSRPACSASRR